MGRQSQRAGENSQQIQVQGDLHQGLSLEEAIRVAELAARKVVADEFARGDELGFRRIEEMNRRIISRLDALERLDAFADPAFQVSFRKAQIGAAATERESDYDLLAGLLEDRALRGEDRHVRAGLNIALQVVDQLDSAALNGLTVMSAAVTYSPAAGLTDPGLTTLDRLFAQFPMDDLPAGNDWIDHLDVLGAVRPIVFGGTQPYAQLLSSAVPGYLATGLEEGSPELEAALAELDERGLRLEVVPHELKPGWRRVPFCSAEALGKTLDSLQVIPERKTATIEIAKARFGLGSADASLMAAFTAALDRHASLRKLNEWWAGISVAVTVTPVGRLLARANAQRLDDSGLLPPLD